MSKPTALTRKDFASDQDVRWCPGCGDYSILANVQRVMPEFVDKRENVVFVSGIGCLTCDVAVIHVVPVESSPYSF